MIMIANKRYYWIKLKEDFFDIETIDWLISQKNGCEYIVLYQKLCLLSANKEGKLAVKIGEMIIPYDADKIARDTKFDVDTVLVAMELFKRIGLIYEQEDGVLKIPYIDEMVGSETSSAKRVREHRQRQQDKKALPFSSELNTENEMPAEYTGIQSKSDTDTLQPSDELDGMESYIQLQCNTNVTPNVTQEIRYKILDNRDKIIDNKDIEKRRKNATTYQQIADMFNDICISFPKVQSLSEKRKKTIRARLSRYSIEQFKEVFIKAEASSFLKGDNNRDWQANFDWMLKESNFPKILEGNYDNRVKSNSSALDSLKKLHEKFLEEESND